MLEKKFSDRMMWSFLQGLWMWSIQENTLRVTRQNVKLISPSYK